MIAHVINTECPECGRLDDHPELGPQGDLIEYECRHCGASIYLQDEE